MAAWLADLLWMLPVLWPSVAFFSSNCPCCAACANSDPFYECICPPPTAMNSTDVQVDISGTAVGSDPLDPCYCIDCPGVDGSYLITDWGTCDQTTCTFNLSAQVSRTITVNCLGVSVTVFYLASVERLRVVVTMTGYEPGPGGIGNTCATDTTRTSCVYDEFEPDCSLSYSIPLSAGQSARDGKVCTCPGSVDVTITPA